jgi:hypothetical protein
LLKRTLEKKRKRNFIEALNEMGRICAAFHSKINWFTDIYLPVDALVIELNLSCTGLLEEIVKKSVPFPLAGKCVEFPGKIKKF